MGIAIGGVEGVAVGTGETEGVALGVNVGDADGVMDGVGVALAVRVGVGVGVAVALGDVDGAGVSAACAPTPLNTTAVDATAMVAVVANFSMRVRGSIGPSSPMNSGKRQFDYYESLSIRDIAACCEGDVGPSAKANVPNIAVTAGRAMALGTRGRPSIARCRGDMVDRAPSNSAA